MPANEWNTIGATCSPRTPWLAQTNPLNFRRVPFGPKSASVILRDKSKSALKQSTETGSFITTRLAFALGVGWGELRRPSMWPKMCAWSCQVVIKEHGGALNGPPSQLMIIYSLPGLMTGHPDAPARKKAVFSTNGRQETNVQSLWVFADRYISEAYVS